MSSDSDSSNRITEVDGLRAIICMTVVAGHVDATYLFWFSGCMEWFFCISGFVISRILIANLGRPGFLQKYFMRRVLRIWPMYYVGMIFAYLVYYVTAGTTNPLYGMPAEWNPQWYEVLMPILFLQNVEMYFGAARFEYLFIFDHSWSLAVEEQFYVLWPLLIFLLTRKASVPTRMFAMVGGLAFAVLLRVNYWEGGAWYFWLFGTRCEGFIFGTALAFLEPAVTRKNPMALAVVRSLRWLWIAPLAMLAPYMIEGYFKISLGIPSVIQKTVLNPFTHFALFGFCVLGYCIFHDRKKSRSFNWVPMLNTRVMQYLGKISYSVYLLHVPVVFAVAPYLMGVYELPPIFKAIIGFGLTIALAHFSYEYVEARAMRLKKHFKYATDKKTERQLVQHHLPI